MTAIATQAVREALTRALPHMELPISIDYVTNFLVTGDNEGVWLFDLQESWLEASASNLINWFCRMRRAPYGLEEFDEALYSANQSLARLIDALPPPPPQP